LYQLALSEAAAAVTQQAGLLGVQGALSQALVVAMVALARLRLVPMVLVVVQAATLELGVLVVAMDHHMPVAGFKGSPVLAVAAVAAHPGKIATLMAAVAAVWGFMGKALMARGAAAAALEAHQEHLQTESAELLVAALVVLLLVAEPPVPAQLGLLAPVVPASFLRLMWLLQLLGGLLLLLHPEHMYGLRQQE
jgi:hypothetical protein